MDKSRRKIPNPFFTPNRHWLKDGKISPFGVRTACSIRPWWFVGLILRCGVGGEYIKNYLRYCIIDKNCPIKYLFLLNICKTPHKWTSLPLFMVTVRFQKIHNVFTTIFWSKGPQCYPDMHCKGAERAICVGKLPLLLSVWNELVCQLNVSGDAYLHLRKTQPE